MNATLALVGGLCTAAVVVPFLVPPISIQTLGLLSALILVALLRARPRSERAAHGT